MNVGAVRGFGAVEGALRNAARATGVDFDFLVRTARRESSFNPSARAPTSSAAGLFQFVEQSWLATVKQHGAKHGLGRYAELISRGPDGRYRVAGDADTRRAVLNLRYDAQASSLMAGEMAADNAAYLRGRTGREPSAGDLYAAHFLGPAGSARLIEAVRSNPDASAARLFPDAASANRSIFYRNGQPASVAQVYANLLRTAGGDPAVEAGGDAAAPIDEASARDLALARRLDRLRSDRNLLNQMNGGAGFGQSLFEAQLMGAFAPDGDEP
ncbi:MAG: transglycosylase SLT domain-containing protein [Caulobacteraceae bacterium]|nr:transglycosylase SLT domain-containing protein [Caulobacteraceae bacterium]